MGPDGTFSHQAAREYGGDRPMREYSTIYSVIKAVIDGEVSEGIVPIENSIEGSINVTLDMLAAQPELYISAEHTLRIAQNLLVKPGTRREDIRVIASHPQAIGQCAHMLNTEFSGVSVESADSTAAAARRVMQSEDGSVACIGAKSSAEIYGLDILMEDCSDVRTNATRFVVISKNQSTEVTENDKSSVAFMLENRPGALFDALEDFKHDSINMIRIESRPSKLSMGKYIFFIDIDGNIDDPTIYFALDKLKKNTLWYKFLGSYKKD